MPRLQERPSLRTELLVNFAILALAALSFAVASVVALYGALDPVEAMEVISLLIAIDVLVVLVFGAYQVHRLVVRPLREVATTAEAIATGDLRRRVAPQASRELHQVAESVNRMTERLLEEQAQLVRAEKLASIGRLAAGVAHEIGNPLGGLNGYAHLLRRYSEGDARALEAVTGMERETARIDRIVRGLLDYARPRRAASTSIDVNDTIRHVVDLLSAQGVLRRVELRLELAAESPAVAGDRHELEQLVVNLLLNAAAAVEGTGQVAVYSALVSREQLLQVRRRRASDDPGVTREHVRSPRVAAWLEERAEVQQAVKVLVADGGQGVPLEDADRIFDPFFTTKEPGEGTGLGLAIVARIVEHFDGVIWVDGAREGGAAFHVVLPL